jgi:hypothetical protein
MQPATDQHEAASFSPDYVYEPVSAEVEELIQRVVECSRPEKRFILYRLLRDLLGEKLDRQYAVSHPDGTSFVFLISPAMSAQLYLTPERRRQLEESIKNPGPCKPFSELVARLEAMES